MFILMGIGFICKKINLIHDQTNKELTNILLYVVSPCIIINSFFQPATSKLLREFGLALVADLVFFAVSVILAKLLFSLPKLKDLPEVDLFKFVSTYSNGGFMGIPLVQAMLGKAGTFFSVPYLVVYNIFLWSHGISIFEKKDRDPWEQLRTILLNPNIIAAVIGVIIFVCHIPVSDIIQSPIKSIVGVNTPLSMIVIGANLGSINLQMLKSAKVWGATLLRNIIFPVIMTLFLSLLPLSHTSFMAIVIMISCPIPGLVVMLSLVTKKSLEFPTQALCLSTILSVLTLPAMIMFASIL